MMVPEPFSYLAEFGHADIAGERITTPGDVFLINAFPARSQVQHDGH